MNEMRHVNYLFATLLCASLASFGCSKDSGSGGGQGTAEAKAAFALFAKDANMVLGINMGHITSSDVYKKYKPMIESQIKSAGDLDEFADCGIDPLVDFKSAIVSGKMDADMEPIEASMIAVVKGPARSKMVACGKKQAEKDGGTVSEEGNFTKVTKKDGEIQWIGWLDDNTMVMTQGMDKGTLETRMKGADGLDTNKDMMELLGNTDQSSGLWFAIKPDNGIKAPAGGMMPMPSADFKAAFGSVSLKSGVAVDIGARVANADEASKLEGELKKQIDEVKPMAAMMGAGKFVDKLKLSSKGADVLAKMKLSMGDIEELEKLAGGM